MLFLSFFLLFSVLVSGEIEFEQYRQLRCSTPDGLTKAGPEAAKCRLILKDKEIEPGRISPADNQGCFREATKSASNGASGKQKQSATVESKERVLCNIACPSANPWFHSPIEQGHKACFKGFGYGLEERDSEWFIWRADKCLNSTATFTVGCKWRGDKAGQYKAKYPNDKALFADLAKISAAKKGQP